MDNPASLIPTLEYAIVEAASDHHFLLIWLRAWAIAGLRIHTLDLPSAAENDMAPQSVIAEGLADAILVNGRVMR